MSPTSAWGLPSGWPFIRSMCGPGGTARRLRRSLASWLIRKGSARGEQGNAMDIVHIGKAKTVYKTENPREYIMEFRDDVTAFDGKRKSTVPDKGRYNAQISARLFELLEAVSYTHLRAHETD